MKRLKFPKIIHLIVANRERPSALYIYNNRGFFSNPHDSGSRQLKKENYVKLYKEKHGIDVRDIASYEAVLTKKVNLLKRFPCFLDYFECDIKITGISDDIIIIVDFENFRPKPLSEVKHLPYFDLYAPFIV